MTAKSIIIESIFKMKYDPKAKVLSDPIVTLDEVAKGIEDFNADHPNQKMSAKNPANFFKDFVRVRASAERNWPPYVLECGFTARQVTGNDACFEFVRIADGQSSAFPPVVFASPGADTPRHAIESVSLPLASRRLGRSDEPWLIQVIARLRIVESHFSLVSKRSIRQLDLLQMSVKLAKTEIDALFLAHEEVTPGTYREVIVTCEAKGRKDDILEDQILRQAKAPFGMRQVTQDIVIPIAVKCINPSEIYVVEFEPVERSSFAGIDNLTIASDSVFEIRPPVPGI
ncbi:MAG: hypothetical protein J0L72_10280 [Armatimonadetes bacterium]|nr:hypothetical protein [Armatimonadota bacterium]